MNFYLLSLIKAAVVVGVLMLMLLYLQWIERRVIARMQVRLGPNRVGPLGLLQPIADSLKLLLKEDLIPPGANKALFVLAPFLAITLSLISISVVPFGPQVTVAGVPTWMQLADLNVGVILILAISSLTVYGVVLAGWASNSKYPLLGALRASAQMISYELPLGLTVAAPLLMSNTLSLRGIVASQAHYYWGFLPAWNVFRGPFPQVIGAAVFTVAAFAETNRVPFDLPEAETELVAGFHTEYSSMKFAGFFMAEYSNMITICALGTVLFLGGWLPPFPGLDAVPFVGPLFWFMLKTGVLLFIFMWVRATMPRLRYDQLMRFAWSFMFPVAMANLLITALLVAWVG